MPALRRYYRGHNLVAMRDVAAGQNRYYHFDHQGTTQCLTDSAGAVTDRFAADAWGVQVKRTGTSINRNWYIGGHGYYREVDAVQSYVAARYLSKRPGRWTSRDPLRLWTTGDLNAYRYVYNAPSRYTDPSGLQAQKEVCCCCVGSFGASDPRLLTTRDMPEFAELDERYHRVAPFIIHGHHFQISSVLRYEKQVVASDGADFRECSLRWWEWDDSPDVPQRDRGKWVEKFGAVGVPRVTFREWDRWMARAEKKCPDQSPKIGLTDMPAIQPYRFAGFLRGHGWFTEDPKDPFRRHLYIYVVIRNGACCKCSNEGPFIKRFLQNVAIRVVRRNRKLREPDPPTEGRYVDRFPKEVGDPPGG